MVCIYNLYMAAYLEFSDEFGAYVQYVQFGAYVSTLKLSTLTTVDLLISI